MYMYIYMYIYAVISIVLYGQIRDVAGQVRHAIFFTCIHTEAGAGAVASPALGRIKAVRYVCVCDLRDVPACAHSHKKDGGGKSNRQRGERDT